MAEFIRTSHRPLRASMSSLPLISDSENFRVLLRKTNKPAINPANAPQPKITI